MKIKQICFLILFAFAFISCTSTKAISVDSSYENEKELIEKALYTEISFSKEQKDSLSEKNFHIKNYDKTMPLPINIYKVNLEKDSSCKITLKSIPEGLMAKKDSKRSVMIPDVNLLDENFNLVEKLYYTAKTEAPTWTESLLYKVQTEWNIQKEGTYYLVVKSDMTSDQGITCVMHAYDMSVTYYFKRIPYGKYKLLLEK